MTHKHHDRFDEIQARLDAVDINDIERVEVEVNGKNDHSEKAFGAVVENAYIDLLHLSAEVYRLRTERIRLIALAHQGTGIDLSPTLLEEPDVMFWYDYIHRLDAAWRARINSALDLED